MIKKDLTGMRFGKLKVIEFAGKAKDGHSEWLCLCDCGNTKIAKSNNLQQGHTKSCGCSFLTAYNKFGKDEIGNRYGILTVIRRVESIGGRWAYLCKCDCGNDVIRTGSQLRGGGHQSCGCERGKPNETHGMSDSRMYGIWHDMKRRCENPKNKRYKNYGGRGITVCPEWRDSFESFRDWALDNGYSDDLTLDRINNDGNYEPSNCHWATLKEQSNNKSNNRMIYCCGETHTLTEWSEITGLHRTTISRRLNKGIPAEEALKKGDILANH